MKTLSILASMLLAATSQSATDAKPAAKAEAKVAPTTEKAAEKPQSIQLEVLDLEGKRFVLVKSISTPEEWASFERDTQIISAQQKDAATTKQLADLALTTPEKEARGNELQAKIAKLQENNATMAKTYNFDLSRQYLVVPTSVRVLTALTSDEYIKLAATKDFKPESVVKGPDDKKFLVRDTVKGAGEVEGFKVQVGRVLETKRALQGLIEVQPRYTKEEDKKKIEEAIRNAQTEVSKSLEEFKRTRGFEIPVEFNIQTAEAKLYTLLSDEEKKSLEEKTESKTSAPEKK
ncbi:MAG: hypothetical protein WCL22_00095 [bacterium]